MLAIYVAMTKQPAVRIAKIYSSTEDHPLSVTQEENIAVNTMMFSAPDLIVTHGKINHYNVLLY